MVFTSGMKPLLLAGVCLFAPFLLHAQDSAAQRHAMATNQLKRLAMDMSAQCLTDIRTLDEWNQRRPELRRQLLEMLGLDPLPARTPLKARITGTVDRPGFRIEKIVFESMPGLFVTGNLYLPKNSAAPPPVILYLCGHSPNPLGAKTEYQDRALWFGSHGYACFILDTIEFGEIAGIHHGTHNLNLWNWFSLGYTPAGVEVWNAMRAIDYLETRKEVDSKRVGLTGISGGGAMTWYTAAVEDRIRVAVPVCSTFTYGTQAEHWLASGQCDCIYYNNTYAWDFPIVGALIAPRPLLILSGRKDGIFPPDGYHAAFGRAKKIYDLYASSETSAAAGAGPRIRELDDDVPHSDPPLFLREARQWMQHWLKNDSTEIALETNPPPKEAPETLACLDRIPAGAINFEIQNRFVPVASYELKSASKSNRDQRRARLRSDLKEKVFRWFPSDPVPFETKVLRTNAGYMNKYADYKEITFQSEAGVRIRAQLLKPKQGGSAAPLLIYAKRAGDSVYFMDTDELLPVFGHYTVLILNARFTEQSVSAVEYADIERTAAWVGRTIAGMQLWDILRAVQWAVADEKLGPPSISFYGKGEMAALGLYAALLDERIKRLVVNDLPASHWQKPALMNVLRVTDIPEVLAMIAPRKVTSVTRLPKAFDYSRRIYRLERATDQLSEAGSLPEALELTKGK